MRALIILCALAMPCAFDASTMTPTATASEWTMRSKQVIVYASNESEARSEAMSRNPGWTIWSVSNRGGRMWVVSMKKEG